MSIEISTALQGLPMLSPGPQSSEAMAKRLNITRRALNLNQAQISEETGIPYGSWNNAENGVSSLSVKQSKKLFDRYQIDLCWIHLGFTGFLPDYIRPVIQSMMSEDPTIGYKRPQVR